MTQHNEIGAVCTSGFIVTKQENGKYAYTMTSVGVDLTEEEMLSLIEEFQGPSPNLLFDINIMIDCTGVAVVGTPRRLSFDEEALCV